VNSMQKGVVIKDSTIQLIKEGLATVEQVKFLINGILEGATVVIVGDSDSGKNVLINELVKYYPDNVRGVFVRETVGNYVGDECSNIEFMDVEPMDGEHNVEQMIEKLASNALLRNRNMYGIEEIRGGEAKYFLSAVASWGQCICTTRGRNVFDGIPHLANLAGQGTKYELDDLLKMFSRCIHVVVYMEKNKVHTIASVDWDDETCSIEYDVCEFD